MIKPFIEVLNLYLKEGNRDNKPKTRKRDTVCAESLRRFFRGKLVASDVNVKGVIRGKTVSDYREWRKAQGASPATIARDISVASSAINYCIRDLDWDLLNPFEKRGYSKADRRKVRPRIRYVTADEQAAILAHCEGVVRDLVEFYLETGMRAQEALNLTWDRVVGDCAVFGHADHKGGAADARFLSDRALAIIDRQPRVSAYVFTEGGQKVGYDLLRFRWRKATRAAGVEDVRIHDLRKTCGDRLRRLYGLEVAQSQLGHKDKRTTEASYAPVSADIVRDALVRSELVNADRGDAAKSLNLVPERGIEPPTYALRMLRLLH